MTNDTQEKLSLEVLVEKSPVEKSQAQKIAADFSGFANKVAEWEKQANDITITSVEDKDGMAAARALRLELRDARVSAEKSHKEWKQDVLDRGRLIDACKNLAVGLIKPIEQDLKDKEDYAIKQEEIRIAELVAARTARLEGLDYPGQQFPDLSVFDDESFEAYLAGVQTLHDKYVAEQKALEEQRIAKEKAEREERERVAKENEKLKAEAIQKEKEAKARALEAEKAKAAEIAKIRAEEATKRKEAEAKAKAEREAIQEKAAKEAAKKQAEYEELEKKRKEQEERQVQAARSNRENNEAALEAILSRHLDGKRTGDITYVMEKVKRYAEGKDDTSWQYGLDPRVYQQAGLPKSAYMGADQEGE